MYISEAYLRTIFCSDCWAASDKNIKINLIKIIFSSNWSSLYEKMLIGYIYAKKIVMNFNGIIFISKKIREL